MAWSNEPSCEPVRSSEAFSKALIRGPAIAASFAAVVVVSHVPVVQSIFKSAFRWLLPNSSSRSRRLLVDVNGPMPLAAIRDAIVGRGRSAVSELFGPPPTVTGYGPADTWYYPLRPREQLAMAILFNNGRARDVQFFHTPGSVRA